MTEKLKNKVVEYLFGHRSNSAKRNTKQTANDGNKKQLANNTIKKMYLFLAIIIFEFSTKKSTIITNENNIKTQSPLRNSTVIKYSDSFPH